MQKLTSTEKYIFKSMLEDAELLIMRLNFSEEDMKSVVTVGRIANIIILRLRRFIRTMDDKELYELLKQMTALKKMRAAQKHALVSEIRNFLQKVYLLKKQVCLRVPVLIFI